MWQPKRYLLEMIINIFRNAIPAIGMLLTACFPYAVVSAQSQLPAPSRTIYKCQAKGAVSYSDEPCAGAQRLDAIPSRGVDHLSGTSRIGTDVAREQHTEQFATALRPLTGMDALQYATAARRSSLLPDVRRQCSQLEPVILELERTEKLAGPAAIQSVQQNLFVLRKRYKTLAC